MSLGITFILDKSAAHELRRNTSLLSVCSSVERKGVEGRTEENRVI